MAVPFMGFVPQRLSRSRVSYPSGFSVCGFRIRGGGFPFCGFSVARIHLYTRARRTCRFCRSRSARVFRRFCRFRLDGRIFFRLHKRAELVQYICFCEDVQSDGGDGAVCGEIYALIDEGIDESAVGYRSVREFGPYLVHGEINHAREKVENEADDVDGDGAEDDVKSSLFGEFSGNSHEPDGCECEQVIEDKRQGSEDIGAGDEVE